MPPDELESILVAVRRVLGEEFAPVTGDGHVVGGFSNQILVLEEPGGKRVLVRLPPVEGPYPPYDVAREGRLMQSLQGQVDVPGIRLIDETGKNGSRPFLVVEWIDGVIKLPGRDAEIGDSDDKARARADAVMAALASVHAVDWRTSRLPGLLGVDETVPLAKRYLSKWEAVLNGLQVKAPSAAWYAFAWLSERLPEEPETKLVHGDFRLGNLLWRGDRVTVIDWELATIGDPLFDLAWTLMGTVSDDDMAMGLVTRGEMIDLYESHVPDPVDRGRLRWWEIMADWIRLCMEGRSFDFETGQPVPDLRCTLWQYGSLRTARDLLAQIDGETGR